MTWIKICGTTSERDADLAIRAGANALGLIMTRSPRQVSESVAYSIGTITPKGVATIGIFVNEELETLIQIARFCKFTGVQLHGDEDADYLRAIRVALPGTILIKAVTPESTHTVAGWQPDRWLVDSGRGAQRGGTGQTFDWNAARAAMKHLNAPVIVAGGLRPDNVKQALSTLQPWGVDVVSGVEAYPGKKHPGLLAQFVDAVKQHDAERSHALAQKGSRS